MRSATRALSPLPNYILIYLILLNKGTKLRAVLFHTIILYSYKVKHYNTLRQRLCLKVLSPLNVKRQNGG